MIQFQFIRHTLIAAKIIVETEERSLEDQAQTETCVTGFSSTILLFLIQLFGEPKGQATPSLCPRCAAQPGGGRASQRSRV